MTRWVPEPRVFGSLPSPFRPVIGMTTTRPNNLSLDLASGAKALSLELSADQADQLLALLDELGKWNRAYNLTAI